MQLAFSYTLDSFREEGLRISNNWSYNRYGHVTIKAEIAFADVGRKEK